MPAIRTKRAIHSHRRGSTDSDGSFDPLGTASSSSRRSSRPISRDGSSRESSLTSLEPSPPPQPKKNTRKAITIHDQRLEPTEVLDTLYLWLAERKAIDDRRRDGMPAPWTKDRILHEYKFCNSYRVLDRTSQFVVSEVIEKGSHLSDTELLFRILLFNAFNRIETWILLKKEFGDKLTWKDYSISAYNKVLSKAKNDGTSLFTAAYLKIGKKLDYDANHMRHLQLLEILMEALPDILAEAEYAADVYEKLAAYPGMAAFTTYQLMISLSYSRLLNFSANDFVVPGPGASSGLVKMFGQSITRAKKLHPNIESDVLRWMVTTQREHFARLGLEFAFLRNKNRDELELDLADMEHAVCEVDKYARKAHPHVKGIGGRAELRVTFTASEDALPKVPALPKAWADPARRVARVRPGPIDVEQKWVLTAILKERPAENGNHDDTVEYLVSWFGYDKPTWEPRYSILEDAPALVAQYEAKKVQKRKKTRR
ncbi:Chromo domain-containing protein [Mycena sanguinolenta]|uniref:Chromo domain-containing protein n=1 Tax=Mycena sanguinolenta TaxID=230812 RepID=A0A8H6Z9C3_9AGAR|nr:Chromo domain-containing protein [Mycena sanguinolenta]